MSSEMTTRGEPVAPPKAPEPLVLPDKKDRVVRIDEGRTQLAEYARQDWVVNAEEGTTIEDILKPEYWSLVCVRMKPYDHIEVRLETGEWIAELIVLQADRLYAAVHPLKIHDLIGVGQEKPLAPEYVAEWKGPQKKWCVIRLHDQHIVQERIEDKLTAQQARVNFERNAKVV
jgi:hypothetical protein